MKYVTILNGEHYEIEIERDGTLLVNGEPRAVDFLNLGPSLYSIITENQSLEVVIEEDGTKVDVLLSGRMYEIQVLDERALLMAQRRGGLGAASGDVEAPMPGLIVDVKASVGQLVTKGETVVILESMKMQNELKAPVDGIVESINVSIGQTVEKGAVLLVVVSEEDD